MPDDTSSTFRLLCCTGSGGWWFGTNSTYDGFRFAYGVGNSYHFNNGGTVVYNPENINDIVGKTITIQTSNYTGSAFTSSHRIFVGNELVYTGNGAPTLNTNPVNLLQKTTGGSISSFKCYNNLTSMVDEQWVSEHQLP